MKNKIRDFFYNPFVLKISFVLISIVFAFPSLIYYFKNKTVLNFDKYFLFLLNDMDRVVQALIYVLILSIMIIIYFLILKNRNRIFKNIKQILIYVLVISLIFVINIPLMCSDIFYYLGIGRLAGKYNQNPYYATITDFVETENNDKYLENDTVLNQGYINDWADTTVVYGPVWTLICTGIARISFGNIDLGLLLFKLINVLIHLLNCYLIYKISNKKIFTLIYGLNPFILIEGIMSVHNDIFVIFFILLALYFLIKKKSLLVAVEFLAISTAIKYFAILLLPFFVIYYFRNENLKKRIIKCIEYGLIFLGILALPYLIYVKDASVLAGIFTQQTRFAKSFYIIISEYFTSPEGLDSIIKKVLMYSFVIVYFFICYTLLFKKKIKFREEMKKTEYILVAFLFLLITNFQPWYIMWLFPLIIWQKAKNIKLILQISLISQYANSIFLAYTERWQNATPFVLVMLTGTLLCIIYNERRKNYNEKKFNN